MPNRLAFLEALKLLERRVDDGLRIGGRLLGPRHGEPEYDGGGDGCAGRDAM